MTVPDMHDPHNNAIPHDLTVQAVPVNDDTFHGPEHSRANASSNWALNTIWWHVYPLGFTGAPIRPTTPEERILTPRLERIIPWLDHLVELGANGLLLGPIFSSQTHGYDTTDYFRIDPRLGDERTFSQLIHECHSRGIKVMLDGVFNHVSTSHPWFQQALAGESHVGAFEIERHPDDTVDYTKFEGFGDLPQLNHDSPEVAQLVGDVMRFWLARGADAWRLDAAYAVPPRFWTRVLPGVRHDFPGAWFMGEVIHGDYPVIIRDSGMDSLTQYELWKAVWSSIKEGNFYELDWSLKRHNTFMRAFTPMTFIGNHDVTRIATQVGQDGAALAATVLFTVGGVPSVYYGDEWGYQGVKEERIGGDDAIRPQFPTDPGLLPDQGRPLFRIYQDLIGFRRRHPWLVTATTETTSVSNRSYAYDVIGRSGQRLHVQLALDPAPHADITDDASSALHVEYGRR